MQNTRLRASHKIFSEGFQRMFPTSNPQRSPSLVPLTDLDLYDKVQFYSPQSGGWVGAVVTAISRENLFELQLLHDGSLVQSVPGSSIKRLSVRSEEQLLRQRQLGASFACEVADEDEFQLEASLFSSKVLKILRASANATVPSVAPSPSLRRSIAHRRSRAYSTLSALSVPSSPMPLLDQLMRESDFPSQTHVMRMLESVRSLHSICPNSFTGGLANSGGIGTGCILGDWCEKICSPDAMSDLLDKVLVLLQKRAPCSLVGSTVPLNGKLVVVGDTHGQLEDVLWLFFKNGFPAPGNIYVFNGDVADRGSHSLEIFILIFLFQLLCPESIVLLRGNHEDDYCNLNYGFCAELRHKFGAVEGGSLHGKFLDVFYALPLSCVVDNWLGGYRCLETGMLIDLGLNGQANAIFLQDRSSGHRLTGSVIDEILHFEGRQGRRELSVEGTSCIRWNTGDIWEGLNPRVLILHGGLPVSGGGGGSPFRENSSSVVRLGDFRFFPNRQKIPPAPKTQLEQWMYQVLWSDPREAGEARGRGTPFYPADTEAFLLKNNLSLLIRSHQLPVNQRGFSFHHKRKLLTVFSASNYCGTSQNFGAVAIFSSQSFPSLTGGSSLVEHWAPSLADVDDVYVRHGNALSEVRNFIAAEVERIIAPLDVDGGEQWLHLQQRVVEYVRAQIVRHKGQLWERFNACDTNGLIGTREWVDICGEVVGWQFPWRTLFNQLDVDEFCKRDDSITFESAGIFFVDFLAAFSAKLSHESKQFSAWDTSVVSGLLNDVFDVCNQLLIGEGLISQEEFEIAFSNTSVSSRQVRVLWTSLLDSRSVKINSIDRSQIGRAYAVKTHNLSRKTIDCLRDVRNGIINQFGSLKSFYMNECKQTNSIEQLAVFLEKASDEIGIDHRVVTEITDILSLSGRVSFLSFYAGLHAEGTPEGARVAAAISDHASAAIYFHRSALRCAFDALDTERSGEINRRNFRKALYALNAALGDEWTLTSKQLEAALDSFAWEVSNENEYDHEQPMSKRSRSFSIVKLEQAAPDEDLDQWVTYEEFLKAFDIVDNRKMSRSGSYGWQLLRDSFGALSTEEV